MPDYPEYNGDLQPACWYEKFYRESLVVEQHDGRSRIVRAPKFTVASLNLIRDASQQDLQIRAGQITLCGGQARYKVVGYYVKNSVLLLERI